MRQADLGTKVDDFDTAVIGVEGNTRFDTDVHNTARRTSGSQRMIDLKPAAGFIMKPGTIMLMRGNAHHSKFACRCTLTQGKQAFSIGDGVMKTIGA